MKPDRKPDDIAYVHITTTVDWMDRLRILFGRELRQRVAVSVWFPTTDRPLMFCESECATYVPHIFPKREPTVQLSDRFPVDGAAIARKG